MSLSASISGLQSKAKPAAGDAARISSLQNQLTAAQNQLTAAQEKLDNLRAFSAESPSACARQMVIRAWSLRLCQVFQSPLAVAALLCRRT